MNMRGFEKVAHAHEITPARPKRVTMGAVECMLIRVDDEIFAIENLCPHQRYSVFHQGTVEQCTITCPMHGWSFDLRTGNAVTGSGHLKTFEIRVDHNDVWMKTPEDEDHISPRG